MTYNIEYANILNNICIEIQNECERHLSFHWGDQNMTTGFNTIYVNTYKYNLGIYDDLPSYIENILLELSNRLESCMNIYFNDFIYDVHHPNYPSHSQAEAESYMSSIITSQLCEYSNYYNDLYTHICMSMSLPTSSTSTSS